jgi:hypothetical protein
MIEADDAVAFVYVPTKPYVESDSPGPQPVAFELRRLGDGSAGLAVFTDLDRLVAALGEYQPWLKISTLSLLLQLSQAEQRVPAVLNPTVEEGADRWTEADVTAYRERSRP